MNDNNDELTTQESSGAENPVFGNPVQAAPASGKLKGIPKAVWIVGGGCLLAIPCIALIAAALYFGLFSFGRDPIASVVPSNSLMYISVDFTQTQSQKFTDIVAIAQEMADADKDKTMADSLDQFMSDELNMSFTEDVMPWIGRHSGLVITDGSFSDATFEMMFIMETRNKGKADEFISKFTTALEDQQGMTFDPSEKDGVALYIDKAESQYEEDMVIGRDGKFVYLSNSENAVLDSINLQNKNSLGSLNAYKDVLKVLPKNRLATLYLSGNAYSEVFNEISSGMYGLDASYMQGLTSDGLAGMAMGLSIEDQGLRMDIATVFDEKNLTEYQKEVVNTKYLKPTTDALIPENTFFFVAANTSQGPGSFTKIDNPLYSSDVTESFDLLNKEYGINVQDLLNLLSGEFAFALGPADDGLFVSTGNINMGLTILAGTNDEQGFNAWFENALNALIAQDPYTEYDISDTQVGDYSLKELSIQDGSDPLSALIYGADNGYIVLGSSQSMLERGFTDNRTLANNETYRQTWKAFPAGGVPYMYLNLQDLMSFLADNAENFGASDLRDADNKLRKIPVIAISMNNTAGYVQSATMIIFIDTGK